MSEAWDDENIKFTYRRIVNHRVMNQWYEVLRIASSISFKEEDDSIIWKFNSKGIYSIQSLYDVINDRGVRHVHTPCHVENYCPSSAPYPMVACK
jgi:hypothetical protein